MANITTRPGGGGDSSGLLSRNGALGALGSAGPASAPDPCAHLAGRKAERLVGTLKVSAYRGRQHGRRLLAVNHDVMVGMAPQSADDYKATTMLTADCAQL